MTGAWARVVAFFAGPELPKDVRRTYRYHFGHVLFDAAAAGILANGPLMATKGLATEDWPLSLPIVLSSIGQFLVLYLGGVMATRRKMPFVVVPGIAFAVCSIAMTFVLHPVGFLALLGLGAMFEVSARPAVAAVVRANYPATHRGRAVGELRKWSSVIFLATTLLSAHLLARFADSPILVIRIQVAVAGVLSLTSYLLFRRIRVREQVETEPPTFAAEAHRSVRETARIVRVDARFRHYLYGGFAYAFGALLYVAYIPAFLVKDLALGYVGAAMFTHIVPSVLAFLTTGAWGRWFDRTNPWRAWAWIRTGWGLDPLLLSVAPLAAAVAPWAGVATVAAGRIARGSVMGGSWVLWWQIGVNHFAPPGGDTTRYLGILVFMNGLTRLVAPLAGAWLLTQGSRTTPMIVGGVLVLGSALHAAWNARRERREPGLATMAEFEAQFESVPRAR